jgi:hypothetical protein
MFTTTFTLDRHIEELRAELRGVADRDEADAIRTELQAMLARRDELIRASDAAL